MAKKHYTSDDINKAMNEMKDGEERFYPGENGFTIHKRTPVRAPGEGLQIISDKEMKAFEERRNTSKVITSPRFKKEYK